MCRFDDLRPNRLATRRPVGCGRSISCGSQPQADTCPHSPRKTIWAATVRSATHAPNAQATAARIAHRYHLPGVRARGRCDSRGTAARPGEAPTVRDLLLPESAPSDKTPAAAIVFGQIAHISPIITFADNSGLSRHRPFCVPNAHVGQSYPQPETRQAPIASIVAPNNSSIVSLRGMNFCSNAQSIASWMPLRLASSPIGG